jgi:hypothetical protein
MTQRGTIVGKRRTPELLRDPESNDCPPGSTCAKAAVERVRQRLQRQRPASERFVHKTGRDE